MIKYTDTNLRQLAEGIHQRYISIGMLLVVPLTLVSCYGGIAVGGGLATQSESKFMVALGIFLLIAGLSSLFWLQMLFKRFFRVPAKRMLKQMIAFEEKAVEGVLGRAGDGVYYNAVAALNGGAIAVDVEQRRIYISSGVYKKSSTWDFQIYDIPASELRSFSALDAGLVLEEVSARADSIAMLQSHRRNLDALKESSLKTGLLLQTQNIHHPEILINFDAAIAKRWLLLLERFCEGSLEAPTRPSIYPSE